MLSEVCFMRQCSIACPSVQPKTLPCPARTFPLCPHRTFPALGVSCLPSCSVHNAPYLSALPALAASSSHHSHGLVDLHLPQTNAPAANTTFHLAQRSRYFACLSFFGRPHVIDSFLLLAGYCSLADYVSLSLCLLLALPTR